MALMTAELVTVQRLASLFALLFCLTLCAPAAVLAADRDVPLVMWSVRDRLSGDRTRLLNARGDLNQRLVQLRGMQTEADKLLCNNFLCAERYAELSAARGKIMLAINDMQRHLDSVERRLIDNNKDLANVEYYIQRYACMR